LWEVYENNIIIFFRLSVLPAIGWLNVYNNDKYKLTNGMRDEKDINFHVVIIVVVVTSDFHNSQINIPNAETINFVKTIKPRKYNTAKRKENESFGNL
jgi:hypothetical protein